MSKIYANLSINCDLDLNDILIFLWSRWHSAQFHKQCLRDRLTAYSFAFKSACLFDTLASIGYRGDLPVTHVNYHFYTSDAVSEQIFKLFPFYSQSSAIKHWIDFKLEPTKDFDMSFLMGLDLQIEIDHHSFFFLSYEKHLLFSHPGNRVGVLLLWKVVWEHSRTSCKRHRNQPPNVYGFHTSLK